MHTPSETLVYLSEHLRYCESLAIERISAEELMLSAGAALLQILQSHYPQKKQLVICCGGGNNAGDGYVLARLAYEQGYAVSIVQALAIDHLPPVAQHAALLAVSKGIPIYLPDEWILAADDDLIIDALIGIGLNGSVREPLYSLITQLNDTGLPIIAVDVPSGLNGKPVS